MIKIILGYMALLTCLFAQNVQVKSYYGKYDISTKEVGKVALSLNKPVQENWIFEKKANEKYKIAVLFPHIKDSYWLAINNGILEEANRLGITFDLYEAGGYNNFGKQKRQFLKVLKSDYDGIILGSISYDKLNNDIKNSDIPVVEVTNDIEAGFIKAKSLVSFFDMGYKAGQYVIKDAKDKYMKVAFLPGPKNSGWADDTYFGFLQAIKDNRAKNIKVYKPFFGDTGIASQKGLIKRSIIKYKEVDYLVGNAVAASIAPDVLKSLNHKNTKIVSTYIIPEIFKMIRQGKVAAASSDMTVIQGRIALDMITKILNGKKAGVDFAFRAGPNIPVLTKDNIVKYKYKSIFGDKNFKAKFSNK